MSKIGHPLRYFIHNKTKPEIYDSGKLKLPSEMRIVCKDLKTETKDFYAVEYSRPKGVLITPIPAGRKIEQIEPPFSDLAILEMSDRFSVCYEKKTPPDLADLLRPEYLGGYELPIKGFGDRLKIPVARSPVGNDSLAKSFVFRHPENGDVDFSHDEQVEKRHRKLFDLGVEVFDGIYGDADLNQQRKVAIAAKVVLWNYRIGPIESNVFFRQFDQAIFTSSTVAAILECLIDAPNMPTEENSEPQKKT